MLNLTAYWIDKIKKYELIFYFHIEVLSGVLPENTTYITSINSTFFCFVSVEKE